MHKCTCDWCPAYRDDLDAANDRVAAAMAEVKRLSEALRGADRIYRDLLWRAEGCATLQGHDEVIKCAWCGKNEVAGNRLPHDPSCPLSIRALVKEQT